MIAPLRRDEIAAAVVLWQTAGLTHPWNDPQHDAETALAHPTATILAAHDDTGELVGTVMAGFDGHRGWLYSLAVADSERGKGTGAALVRAAEEWLVAHGTRVVRLLVEGSNAKAGGFYEAIGYERGDFIAYGKRL